jgi:hypothetical protein
MTIVITVVVQVPDVVAAKEVADEITSNLESCEWTVITSCHAVVPEQEQS